MIEIGKKPVDPIETWSSWPAGKLHKGDLLRVSWSYEGVHGPVYHEDNYILLECVMLDNDKETWDCLIFDRIVNGEKRETEKLRHHTIYSSDFESNLDGDWQRISLIARAEQ